MLQVLCGDEVQLGGVNGIAGQEVASRQDVQTHDTAEIGSDVNIQMPVLSPFVGESILRVSFAGPQFPFGIGDVVDFRKTLQLAVKLAVRTAVERLLGEGSYQYLVFVDAQVMVAHEAVLQEDESGSSNQGERNDVLEADEYRTQPLSFSTQGVVAFQHEGRREGGHVPRRIQSCHDAGE